MEEREPLSIAGETVNWRDYNGEQNAITQKIKKELSYDPANFHLGLCPKEIKSYVKEIAALS